MKKAIIVSVLGSFSTLLGNLELSKCLELPEYKEIPQTQHRLFIDPNIFWSRGKEDKDELFKIRTRDVFYGIRGGYEYIQKNFFYAGIDGLYSFGKSRLDISRRIRDNEDDLESSQSYSAKVTYSSKKSYFINVETRIGYSFQPLSYLTLTPFLGAGRYHIKNDSPFGLTQQWTYSAGGLRTSFALNSIFELGINLKAMHVRFVKSRLTKGDSAASLYLANSLGYEIDVPFTYNFGDEKNWTTQLEPYFLKLNIHTNSNIYGGKLLLTYCF